MFKNATASKEYSNIPLHISHIIVYTWTTCIIGEKISCLKMSLNEKGTQQIGIIHSYNKNLE
jgi:hypothetical protein